MIDNRTLILDEVIEHFNEPVLAYDNLVRLIGFGEDESDYYYICVHVGGETVWYTAVGGMFYLNRLKGQGFVTNIDGKEWDDFLRLDSFLSLNSAPKVDEMLIVSEKVII